MHALLFWCLLVITVYASAIDSEKSLSKSAEILDSADAGALNLLEQQFASTNLDEFMEEEQKKPLTVTRKIYLHQMATRYNVSQDKIPTLLVEDLGSLLYYLAKNILSLDERKKELMIANLRYLIQFVSSSSTLPSSEYLLPSIKYWGVLPDSIQRKILTKFGSLIPRRVIQIWIIYLIKAENTKEILSKLITLLGEPNWSIGHRSDLLVKILTQLFDKKMSSHSLKFSAFVLLRLHEQNAGLDDEELWDEAGCLSIVGNGKKFLAETSHILPVFSATCCSYNIDPPRADIPLIVRIYLFEAFLSVSKIHKLTDYRERAYEISKQLLVIRSKTLGEVRKKLEEERRDEIFRNVWHVDAYRLLMALMAFKDSPFNQKYFQEYNWHKMDCRPNSAIILHSKFFLKLEFGGICDAIQKLHRQCLNHDPMNYSLCHPDAPLLSPNIYTLDLSELGNISEPDEALILMKALLLYLFKIPLDFSGSVALTTDLIDIHDVEFIANTMVDRHCQLHHQSRANVRFEIKTAGT